MSTTTGFLRNPAQLAAVVRLQPIPRTAYVFGAADGCEAYTLAMYYHLQPTTDGLSVRGFDVDNVCLDRSRLGIYTLSQIDYYRDGTIWQHPIARFLQKRDDGGYGVDTTVAARCSFGYGDILDRSFMETLPPGDIVCCQNVLVHMSRADNRRALANVVLTMRRGGLVLLGGMDPNLRSKLTQDFGFTPVTQDCRLIHEGWRDLRQFWDQSHPWLRRYYALEPFQCRADWAHRYSSIFRLDGR